jgi:hypothetical protein
MKWLLILLALPASAFANNYGNCFIDVKVIDSKSGISRAAINVGTIKFYYPLKVKVLKNKRQIVKEITVLAFSNDIKDQNQIDSSFDQTKELIRACERPLEFKKHLTNNSYYVKPKVKPDLKQKVVQQNSITKPISVAKPAPMIKPITSKPVSNLPLKK